MKKPFTLALFSSLLSLLIFAPCSWSKSFQSDEADDPAMELSIHYVDGLSSRSHEKPQEIRFLQTGCHLSLLLTNTTDETITLWKPYCPEGDDAIRLEFKRTEDTNIHFAARPTHCYTGGMGIAKTMKLVAGDSLVYQIDFSSYWSLPFVLNAGQQTELLVRAVYQSKPVDEATQGELRAKGLYFSDNTGNVWEGRIETDWQRVIISNVTDEAVPKGHRGINILR